GVGKRLHLRFEGIDLGDDLAELSDDAFVAAAEDAGEQAIEHWMTGWMDGRPGCPARECLAGNGKRAQGALSFGRDIVAWGSRDRLSSHVGAAMAASCLVVTRSQLWRLLHDEGRSAVVAEEL